MQLFSLLTIHCTSQRKPVRLLLAVFCALALIAGAALNVLGASPQPPLATGSTTSITLVQFTDMHMGDYSFSNDRPARLARIGQLIAGINTIIQPVAVVGTGDWVSVPSREAYGELKEALRSLQVPFYPVRGNHDTPPNLFVDLIGARELSFDAGGWRIIGLDEPPRNLGWLDLELRRQAPFGPSLLFQHRPMALPPDMVLEPIGGGWLVPEPQRSTLYAKMAAYDVPAWLSGHVHEGFMTELQTGGIGYGAQATAMKDTYNVYVLEGRQAAMARAELGRWPLIVPLSPAMLPYPAPLAGPSRLRVKVFADAPVSNVTYRVNAGAWSPLTSCGDGFWEATWSPAPSLDGMESIVEFQAICSNGRSGSVQVKVLPYPNAEQLAISLLAPAPGSQLQGLVEVRANVNADDSPRQIVLFVDGERRGPALQLPPGERQANLVWDTAQELAGRHRLWLKATDARRQIAYSDPLEVEVESARIDPPPRLTLRPLPASVYGLVSLWAEAEDEGGIVEMAFEYRPLDGSPWRPIARQSTIDHSAAVEQSFPLTSTLSAEWSTIALPNGYYEVRALASDTATYEQFGEARATVWLDNGQAGTSRSERAIRSERDDLSQLYGQNPIGSNSLLLGGNNWCGLRFGEIPIPAGSRIVSATLSLMPDGSYSTWKALRVHSEASASPPDYGGIALASRPLGSQEVIWQLGTWWYDHTWVASPNLAPIIQEAISRPGWAPGNAISLIILPGNAGQLKVHSYETGLSRYAPRLSVAWMGPAAGTPTPTLTLTPSSTATSTPSPTATPSPTPTPTSTPTGAPTATITPSPSPAPSDTPTAAGNSQSGLHLPMIMG